MTTVQRLIHRYMGAGWVLIILAACGYAWLATDRTAPFESRSYVATAAKRGGVAFIDAAVVRDLDKSCSVWFSRFFIDAAGRDWQVLPHTYRSEEALQKMNESMPNSLGIPIAVPLQAAAGPARLIIPLSYRCNITHSASPIEVVLVYEFEVLP